ncbi:DNA cytosine methyltransferase [Corynebacterium kozikiae]|uniref:DNA cytosine methyltransferase n=1 Tax=Corynebacterium kozikiae TaxID=2968469 RepID=UPI00211C08ED|nr:DNA cytosine methyltransferase [Corynebacterium sp. 76QC2CO]MCQ9344284.1 DNA cytosine methyltransferase [Corynebacterium sp. 76QC2CO]
METIRITDLFSGAGGMSAGLLRASSRFQIAEAVELNSDASATFAANFPDAIVRNVPIQDWLKAYTPEKSDVVVGGPPCQGFSSLGKGKSSDLNSLWESYARAVEIISPDYFILENVPQFLKSEQFKVFQQSLESGHLKNYEIEPPRVLDASDYGVPQRRKRILVLGTKKGKPKLTYPRKLESAEVSVRQAWVGIPHETIGIDLPDRFVSVNGNSRPGKFQTNELHLSRNYTELSMKRFLSIPYGGSRHSLPESLQAPCWRGFTKGASDVMGRLRWENPSVTIRTEFFKPEKGRYLHPEANRAITHWEAARLMQFPDSYFWVGSKTSIARQIGNAVPLGLMAAVGDNLLRMYR